MTAVNVPGPFEELFERAREYVARYFASQRSDPSRGVIDVMGERYVLVRAASVSVEFFDLIHNIYDDPTEADQVARNLLFDFAHAMGRADARSFSERMEVVDPIERLSVGPWHFAYSGWAGVSLLQGSSFDANSNFYLNYEHPNSFEADAWTRAGRVPDAPICAMNAGYSSGWTQESFGLNLIATEVFCRARGDEACRFVMAPPEKIAARLEQYAADNPWASQRIRATRVPSFFSRKRIVEELRDSEAQYRAVFEGSRDGLAVLDREGRIVTANPAFQLALNTREALYAKRFNELFVTDPPIQNFAVTNDGQNNPLADARSRTAPSHRIFELRLAPIVFRGQDHVLAALRDVTDRRLAEDALRGLKANLEQEVQRRTEELRAREEQLRQAQKLEAVSQLAGGIAHDFHNLLTVIQGYSSLLAEGKLVGTEALDAAQEIDRAVERASQLTQRLLATSRRQNLRPEVLELGRLIRAMVEMLQRVIGEDYSIVVESAADLPCCRIDPGQLKLAILNLVVNARDAMPDGGIIEIKVESAAPPNAAGNSPRSWNRNGDLPPTPPADSDSYVCIRIRDSGVGIAPDVFDRIFEPFFTTKDVGRGSGLGLSTVLGIVKQSRGYVGVQSEIGRGSTFSLFLPTVTDSPPTVSPNSRPARPARGHILLVEDDPAIRTMLVTVLRDAGYEVSVSADGLEASELASAATTPYDLLLSDVVMPRRTGIELARELRARWKTLPVLFISGYTQRGSSPLTPIPPDTRLLPKPFSIDDLLRAVSDAINELA